MAAEQAPDPQTTPGRDVFVSYASQDALVANAMVEALEERGIRCWIAPRDVRPGMVYADAIVGAINESKALVLVLSAKAMPSAHVGREVERAAAKRKQLIAFRVDTAPLSQELEYFLSNSQWIDVPLLGMPHALTMLAESVRQRTGTGSATVPGPAALTSRKPDLASWRSKAALFATIAVLVAALGYLVANRFVLSKRGAEVETPSGAATQNVPAPAAAFNPPPHSIAVLPFVNMSGDKEQDYFSEGLTEELLNSLSRLNQLQVAARTSSFSFQGEHPDIATVAHKLNVGAVLEGSVRRSGHTVRITAQLVNGVTGFHLWSQTYDRDLKDILKLQTEIANAVASALKLTLLGDVLAKIEIGGTRNPAALDAYLRASTTYSDPNNALTDAASEQRMLAAIAGYTQAIRLDPNYALAYADRSLVVSDLFANSNQGPAARDYLDKARADARQAIALAPELAEGHLALAILSAESLEFTAANEQYERALALAPGDANVLRDYASFAISMGHTEAGLTASRRQIELDPLNPWARSALANHLMDARHYDEAIVAAMKAKALAPHDGNVNAWLGLSYYFSGHVQSALTACDDSSNEWQRKFCLTLVYEKLGRHADAQSMFAKFRQSGGDNFAEFDAMIYAQWGDTARALDSLETAMRRRNPWLVLVKTGQYDSLRQEPRFKAIERELKFPD